MALNVSVGHIALDLGIMVGVFGRAKLLASWLESLNPVLIEGCI